MAKPVPLKDANIRTDTDLRAWISNFYRSTGLSGGKLEAAVKYTFDEVQRRGGVDEPTTLSYYLSQSLADESLAFVSYFRAYAEGRVTPAHEQGLENRPLPANQYPERNQGAVEPASGWLARPAALAQTGSSFMDQQAPGVQQSSETLDPELQRVLRSFAQAIPQNASAVGSTTDFLETDLRDGSTVPNAYESFGRRGAGVSDAGGNQDDAIIDLFSGPGGITGIYSRVLDMSRDDPEQFIALQLQLMQHGYISGDEPLQLGELDELTFQALGAVVNAKWRAGSDETLESILAGARAEHEKQTLSVFSGVEQAREAEIEALRNNIEMLNVTNVLTDPAKLTEDIQRQALDTLGRRLGAEEVQLIIDDVHAKDQAHFLANNADVQRYNRLMEELSEIATGGIVDDFSRNIQGGGDLESFLAAVRMQESGGDPTAVNPHSGAFGLYGFMPGTWRDATTLAGLDPNDRSEENQHAVARVWAAKTYLEVGSNWYDTARGWYAGAGWVQKNKNNQSAGNAGQRNDHPSINDYGEQIMERMRNGGQLDVDYYGYGAADAGSLGGGAIQQEDLAAWWEERQSFNADGTPKQQDDGLAALSDLPPVGSYVDFDPQAYLRAAVKEQGGVDADVYTFVNRATEFFDLLGSRWDES